MKIYTKTGDSGETGLLGGLRVSKNHAAIAACGDVDETNCQIGLALSLSTNSDINHILAKVQRQLFVVGGQVASCLAKDASKVNILSEDIEGLEKAIDKFQHGLPELAAFIMPGGCQCAAILHVARSVARRAERSVVELIGAGRCGSELSLVLIYLNRLSDFLFVAARRINLDQGVEDERWLPGAD